MCVKDASHAMLRNSMSLGESTPLLYMGIAVAKNSSVHVGSSSKNGSHAVFHCPIARIASQAGVSAAVFRVGVTPAALASSRSIGAPRLHEWTDIREPALSTNRISSRVAPASSAARMCRRVPSGLRLVHAAFIARLINSTVLRGKTAELHGLVVIFAQVSAHSGSHSRICASAASHGPVSLDS